MSDDLVLERLCPIRAGLAYPAGGVQKVEERLKQRLEVVDAAA